MATSTAVMATLTSTPLQLTTVFTPSPTCIQESTGSLISGHYYNEFDPVTWIGSWTKCYPPHFSNIWSSSIPGPGYYSPGICPSGYTIGSDIISAYVGYYSLAVSSQTGGRCCLDGWYPTPYEEYCVKTISSALVSAPGINIRWMATDLSLYDPSSPGMPSQSQISPGQSTVSVSVTMTSFLNSSTSIPAGSPRTPNSRAPVTMIIAIVIPLTIFAVAIIAYSIFRKRRAATRSAQQTHEVGELDSRPIHEAQEKHLQVTRGELDTGTYHAAELG